MKLRINALTVSVLGDPHLGKEFKNGVPLHRRGEREAQQCAAFESHLNEVEGVDVHVCLGDIFDAFSVEEAVVLRTAALYQDAAAAHPDVTYVILRGNHDAVRDADRKSSFDVLKALLGGVPNITVVDDRAIGDAGTSLLFCPWHPFKDARTIVSESPAARYAAAFGHWDLRNFGQENPNLIPIDELARRTSLVFTGHEHTSTELQVHGVRIVAAGAMLPYAHGEDPNEKLYVTRTLDQVLADPAAYRDKCLRILLKPGEELPEIDCLQLTPKRVEELDPQDLEVSLGDFDFPALFIQAMDQKGVNEGTRAEVWELYQQLRHDRS